MVAIRPRTRFHVIGHTKGTKTLMAHGTRSNPKLGHACPANAPGMTRAPQGIIAVVHMTAHTTVLKRATRGHGLEKRQVFGSRGFAATHHIPFTTHQLTACKTLPGTMIFARARVQGSPGTGNGLVPMATRGTFTHIRRCLKEASQSRQFHGGHGGPPCHLLNIVFVGKWRVTNFSIFIGVSFRTGWRVSSWGHWPP
jgi:hypothetical protein